MSNNKAKKIVEGNTSVFVFQNKNIRKGPGSREKTPFYNPAMELNRDLSMLVCQWLVNSSKNIVKICDGLAASGIRGIRIANEVEGIFETTINDWDKDAYNLIKKNVEQNKLKNIEVFNENLNSLLSQKKYDYIDIDPFGTPVFFVDSAIRSIKNNGIIACTATDTATLCGVYPDVCLRRYGAIPFHSPVMKEIGIRIILGFLCREAAKYDKAIEPMFCYVTDHYFRVYIRVINGVNRANSSIKNLKTIKSDSLPFSRKSMDIGPLWMGKTLDDKIIKELTSILFSKKLGTKNILWKMLDVLEEESHGPAFFYNVDDISSILKCSPPKTKTVFEKIKKQGFNVYHTHFSPVGFKTDAPQKVVFSVFKNH